MRRIAIIAAFFATIMMASTAASVNDDDIITDAEIVSIRTHCSDIRGTLTRLQQSDTLLRLDRGQLYRQIADKLMVPLNQRIASNQLDGSRLVATTARYDDEYQKFFRAYTQYDSAISLAISTDCTRRPTTFYDRVMDARQKRIELNTVSRELTRLAGEYKIQFNEFRTTVEGER